MIGCNPAKDVDIIVYTKDRPMQLHLLLESLQKYVTGMGRIVITLQPSSSDYEKGYTLLKDRLMNDAFFEPLRKKASFAFHERESLEKSIEALPLLGDSDYILPLCDDAVFYRHYDLVNAKASRYFFENKNVLNCSIRLGKNITPTIPELHKDALFEKPQPKFSIETEEMLGWYWPDAMNTFEWCNPVGMCNIFRKSNYFEWFHKFKNPVWIEGDAKRYLENVIFKLPNIFNHFLRFVDLLQYKLLKKLFGVYEQEIIRQFLSKVLFRIPFLVDKDVPALIVTPKESVVLMPDVNSTLPEIVWRNKSHTLSFEELNKRYLMGFKLSMNFAENYNVDFSAPWDINLKDYFQFEKFNETKKVRIIS